MYLKIKTKKSRKRIKATSNKKWFDRECRLKRHELRRVSNKKKSDPFKVHLTPKLFFGRDETVQHSHKEFDNFICIWYF